MTQSVTNSVPYSLILVNLQVHLTTVMHSLNFTRLLASSRFLLSAMSVTEGVKTTQSNCLKFRLHVSDAKSYTLFIQIIECLLQVNIDIVIQ